MVLGKCVKEGDGEGLIVSDFIFPFPNFIVSSSCPIILPEVFQYLLSPIETGCLAVTDDVI
jgi:hypothetical protein